MTHEEKELKKLEMYCAQLHDLGMRDEANTISEEDSEYEYKKWTDYLKKLLASKDKEIKELRTRVADWRADAVKHAQEVLELRARLSTLLKASEGMEKALEMLYSELVESNSPRCDEWSTPAKIIKQALADFRAVKEGL